MKKFLLLTIALVALPFFPYSGQADPWGLRLRVVFDNVRYAGPLESAWGFSCIIEGLPRVILFDTGSDGNILLANMKKILVDPKKVEAVFLSHFHADHTGGLEVFLQQHPGVTVYLPASFPASFQKSIAAMGAKVIALEKPGKLFDKVYTTGELGSWPKEQSLVIDTPRGLVIITGCAHPGVARIVAAMIILLPKTSGKPETWRSALHP